MRRIVGGLFLGALLIISGTGVLAQSQSTIHPHQDLLYTDVQEIEDLAPLGTSGYAAATQGGLVLWWGDGPRSVMTRMDGLPSNVVWSVEGTGDGRLLVGTEFGAALVDPSGPTVDIPEATGETKATLEKAVVDVSVLDDGSWAVVARDGNLSIRDPDGSWTAYEAAASNLEVTAFYADGNHTLVGGERQGLHRLTDQGTWEQLVQLRKKVSAVAVYQDRIFLGTERGGITVLDQEGNTVDADLPELVSPERSNPLTILTMEVHQGELWVGTPLGYAVHHAPSESWRVVGHEKLHHRWVQAILPVASETHGADHDQAAVGTLKGVGWPRFDQAPDTYDIHTTLNGPLSNQMRGLGVNNDAVWVTTQEGLGIHSTEQRTWVNLDRSNGLPFERLTSVDFDEQRGIAWMSAMGGAIGLDIQERSWHVVQDQSPISDPPNVYFDLDVDGRYLWMPEYWNGLVRYDIEDNETDRFNIDDGLLSRALTCTERWNEFLVVCAQDVVQVFNLSLATPRSPLGPSYDLCSGPRCDNYPADSTLTALADGPRLWLGTVDGGVVLVERNTTEGVAVTGHWDMEDDLPAPEVRSLAPAPGGVWAGTVGGLARIDATEGVTETWSREAGLDHTAVNGLAQVDDVLYLSTLSGLYRLDLETDELLPLHEAGGEFEPPEATLRFTFPPPGATLHRPVNMTGTVIAAGQGVDLVEVRIDDGPWEMASGTSSWRYHLPIDELEPGSHNAHVRAVRGGETLVERNRTFEVGDAEDEVQAPELDHRPPTRVEAGDRLDLEATLQATDPVNVVVEAVVGARAQEVPARVVGDKVSVSLDVPSRARGDVTYRFHVSSGAGEASFPSDDQYHVPIIEPRVRDLSLEIKEGELPLRVGPGESGMVTALLTNDGNEPEKIRLMPGGLHPGWVSVETPLIVPPDGRVAFDITISVPEDALPTSTALTLTAQPQDGAFTRTLSLPVEVTGTPQIAGAETQDAPAPAGGLVAIGLVAAALLAVRRRRGSP